jgi:hypothetical protein
LKILPVTRFKDPEDPEDPEAAILKLKMLAGSGRL